MNVAMQSKVESVIRGYAGQGINGYSYFLHDDMHHVMSIVGKYAVRGEQFVDTSPLVRLVDDRVIIERDMSNKPLVDSLVQAGLAREQIVLAYAGEPVEEIA